MLLTFSSKSQILQYFDFQLKWRFRARRNRENALYWDISLFERADYRLHYKLRNIQLLLNQSSRYKYAPNPSKIPWGDAFLGTISMHSGMQRVGTRRTNKQHNTKKAVLAMLTYKDPPTGQVLNRDLLNAMMAHADDSEKAK